MLGAMDGWQTLVVAYLINDENIYIFAEKIFL